MDDGYSWSNHSRMPLDYKRLVWIARSGGAHQQNILLSHIHRKLLDDMPLSKYVAILPRKYGMTTYHEAFLNNLEKHKASDDRYTVKEVDIANTPIPINRPRVRASNEEGMVSTHMKGCKVTVVFHYKEALEILQCLRQRYDVPHTLSFPINFENILREAVKEAVDTAMNKVRDTTIEMLRFIELNTVIYNVHYCKAGVGFQFYEEKQGVEPCWEADAWRQNLVTHQYYKTFSLAVKGEYERIKTCA